MLSSSGDSSFYTAGKTIRPFFQKEIDCFLQANNCVDLDKEGIKQLLIRLHNGVVPSDATVSLFFRNGVNRVGAETIMNVLSTSVEIPDFPIKPNAIFPVEQTKITPFRTPDSVYITYNDYDYIPFKSGYIKRGQKSLFSVTYNIRFCKLERNVFTIYEKDSNDRISLQIYLKDIDYIEMLEEEKNVFPFVIHVGGSDIVLAADDEQSRTDWLKHISSLIVLYMASTGIINEERFKYLIESGNANMNACYSREDPRPVLYYLLKQRDLNLANWLIQRGAHANCILRWQFVVKERVLTPKEILDIMEINGLSLNLKSDDGFNYNIMHYMCYFGNCEGVKKLVNTSEAQSLLNDPTESNDIAITIALLSPLTTPDCKVQIASLIYALSNIPICNRSLQNPVQIALLMGKIDLLFHLLPFSVNLRHDQYHNSILHLAIKAGLTTVARYILQSGSYGNIDQLDSTGDSVLTLSIKANNEELAYSILQEGANASIMSTNWQMKGCEKDLCVHQALKRDMPSLANAILLQGHYSLCKDTQGDLPIHLALMYHLKDCIDLLIQNSDLSSYINEPNDRDHDTALHLALKLGYYEPSLQLLRHHANVNAVNSQGYTPVHILIKLIRGDYNPLRNILTNDQMLGLLKELLRHNPDITITCKQSKNVGSETALHMAIRGNTDLTTQASLLLIQYDPSIVYIRDYEQCTPLIRAVEMRSLILVQALCDNNSELDVINTVHDTPLHIAVANNDDTIVSYLVTHSAYLRVWNKDGYYPMHIAIQNSNPHILEMLCPYEIDANLTTREGITPFILACMTPSLECANFLLKRGADPYLLNRDNQSCITVLAELVKKNPSNMDYAPIACRVSSLAKIFERECFMGAAKVNEAVTILQRYIDDASAKGIINPDDEINMPRMSIAPAQTLKTEIRKPVEIMLPVKESYASTVSRQNTLSSALMSNQGTLDSSVLPKSVASASSTLRLPPPLPPTSEPPVGTLHRGNSTLKKDSTLTLPKIKPENDHETKMRDIRSEIINLELSLKTIETEYEKECKAEEGLLPLRFKSWCKSDNGRIMIQRTKQLYASKGYSESQSEEKALHLCEKKIIESSKLAMKKRFEEKRNAVVAQIDQQKELLKALGNAS